MEFFKITVEEGVGILRFERPPVNAVSHQVYVELGQALAELAANEDVRVVVFTGSPNVKAFCGGADLKEFLQLDYESRLKRYEIIDQTLPKLGNFPKPIIAVANGPAVGVGVALLSLCDIRFASEEAFFMIPEIDRGVVSNHLPKMKKINVPEGIAKEWILTARRIPVAEAHRYGFIDHVVAPAYLLEDAMRVAKTIAKKPKKALLYFKQSFIESETMSWIDSYKKSHVYSAELTAHSNSKEGIRAFLENRTPEYND